MTASVPIVSKVAKAGGLGGRLRQMGGQGLEATATKTRDWLGSMVPGEIRTPDLLIRSQTIPRVYWETGDYCLIWASLSASFVEEELAQESRERR